MIKKRLFAISKLIIRVVIIVLIMVMAISLYNPAQNDLVLFALAMASAAIILELTHKKLVEFSPLLELVIFYAVVFAAGSIIVPALDALIMSIAGFVANVVSDAKEDNEQEC